MNINLVKNKLNENISKQIILGLLFWPTYIILFSSITSNFEKVFLLFTILIVLNEYFNIFNIKKIKIFIWTILLTALFFSIIITSVNFYYGFSSIVKIFKFIYEILLICIIGYMIKSFKSQKVKKCCLLSEHLFSYRKNEIKILNERIMNKNIPSILIYQKIGTGKSTLIDHYLENEEKGTEVIYIKLPLIENISDLKRIVFQEIQVIFKKNNISSFYLKNLLKYFSNIKLSNLEFSLNKKVTTLWSDLKDLKTGLLELENKSKKILLIIDDIERVQDANLIKNSITFIGEIGEYFRGTSTTILYLADKEEVETRIKAINANYKTTFLDKYFMNSFKMNSPVIENLTHIDIDILIHELLPLKERNSFDIKKYHDAMMCLFNGANKINEIYLSKISDLEIKQKEISKEILNNKEMTKLPKTTSLAPEDKISPPLYIIRQILELEEELKEVTLELSEAEGIYKNFKSNNNLRNIKRFLIKTTSISKLKCHNGINIAFFSILYFIEIFYPIYHYSISNRIDYIKKVNETSTLFKFFYNNILNVYSLNVKNNNSNHYYNTFYEKSLLIFDFYSSNSLEKEHLTIGDKILVNIFEGFEVMEIDVKKLNNINFIFNEIPNNSKEINTFFENKLYLEKLFSNNNNLIKITEFLLNQAIISKLALENIILFFEKKVKDRYFNPPKKTDIASFFNASNFSVEEQKQTELKNVKEVLEKIIEKNHCLSNIFLEKINLIIQHLLKSIKGLEEEEIEQEIDKFINLTK